MWKKLRVYFAAVVCFCTPGFLPSASAQEAKRQWTIAGEIGLTTFNDFDGWPPEVHFSPDGAYFAVWSERGNLRQNCVEDSLRFYRTGDVEKFLENPANAQPPSPAWVLTRSNFRGRVIDHWRWLKDSSAVAYTERSGAEGLRLALADVQKRTVELLTDATERLENFDIADRQHYVFASANLAEATQKTKGEWRSASIVFTDRPAYQLIAPQDELFMAISSPKSVWAVSNGKRWEVKQDGKPVDYGELAMSPDGSSLVTTVDVSQIPETWERLYPAADGSAAESVIRRGRKDVRQYTLLNLETGATQPLIDAPLAEDAGWSGGSGADWSKDGKEVLLAGTFIPPTGNASSGPCLAIVDRPSKKSTCVETSKIRARKKHGDWILDAEFAAGDKSRVLVRYFDVGKQDFRNLEYRQGDDGKWQSLGVSEIGRAEWGGLEISVKQGLNEPPVLTASSKGASRALWDPNPQLRNTALGEASVYTWKDEEGREVRGGLYKPVGYKPGQRYPLVIQTHGFGDSWFTPSGVFPTGFAARAFSDAGMVVLQSTDGALGCSTAVSPEEGPCAVAAYEGAVKQLVSEGLVDPDKVGIIGFSRSCYDVMEMLTTSSVHLKAALISDGVTFDYFSYILWTDRMAGEAKSIFGGEPFGSGLEHWLKRSPGFNLDKINAPLLVAAAGPVNTLTMWQSYAGLRELHKPTEMVMLNTDEHVLTNPAVRMASQGGSVDWFRFWLQGYEDPDPAKAEQYKRWRGMRELQAKNDKETNGAQSVLR